jgi:hypothetical protein
MNINNMAAVTVMSQQEACRGEQRPCDFHSFSKAFLSNKHCQNQLFSAMYATPLMVTKRALSGGDVMCRPSFSAQWPPAKLENPDRRGP